MDFFGGDEEAAGGVSGEWEGEAEDGGPFSSFVGACLGCCLGIVMLPAAMFLLGWNENNFVCEARRIIVAHEEADVIGCARANDLTPGGLYSFSCPFQPSTLETFTPASFGLGSAVAVPSFSAASGRMQAEMHLCKESCHTETSKNSAGQNKKTTKCTYDLEWSSTYSAGDDFRSNSAAAQRCGSGYTRNPPEPSFPLGSHSKFATGVKVGDPGKSYVGGYTLNDPLVLGLPATAAVSLNLTAVAAYTGARVSSDIPTSQLSFSKDTFKWVDGVLKSCNQDVLGCIRISFFKSPATSPSVITKVIAGGMTEAYMMPGSWGCPGQRWQAIFTEKMSKADVIQALKDANNNLVWIIRFVGLILCWLAVYLFFSPIVAAAECVGEIFNFFPCGGYIQDALEGVATAIVCAISCPIGCSCGLFVIAIVWLFMRPLYGAIMLGICVCCCGGAVAIRSSYQKPQKGRTALPSVEE